MVRSSTSYVDTIHPTSSAQSPPEQTMAGLTAIQSDTTNSFNPCVRFRLINLTKLGATIHTARCHCTTMTRISRASRRTRRHWLVFLLRDHVSTQYRAGASSRCMAPGIDRAKPLQGVLLPWLTTPQWHPGARRPVTGWLTSPCNHVIAPLNVLRSAGNLYLRRPEWHIYVLSSSKQ